MATGVNRVIILGNVGKDPEVTHTPNGLVVAKFSVATTESWKDKSTGEKRETTEWHRIVIFGKLAEICEKYLKKGSKVYLEGKLKTNKWQDKETGQDRYSTDILAESMRMIGSKKDSDTNDDAPVEHLPEDDLPW